MVALLGGKEAPLEGKEVVSEGKVEQQHKSRSPPVPERDTP